MGRTVNRQPFSVATPSSNDSKDYFFNQVNWKGMNVDKNFLAADQESFESCENVYVNSQGILRSRPSLKRSYTFAANIVDCWSISGEIFYLLQSMDDTAKHAIKHKDFVTPYDFDRNVKLLVIEDNVYIFSKGVIKYFNLSTLTYDDAINHVYAPRKVIDLFSYEETEESLNILNSTYTNAYQYQDGVEDYLLTGKNLRVKINGETKEFVYNDLSKFMFYNRSLPAPFELKDSNYHFRVYQRDGYDSIALLDRNGYKLYYSIDGSHWDLNIDVPNSAVTIEMEFTDDGNAIYIGGDDFTWWIVSVVQTADADGNLYYRYPEFTSLNEIIKNPNLASQYSIAKPHVISPEDMLYVSSGDDNTVIYRILLNGKRLIEAVKYSHAPYKTYFAPNYSNSYYSIFPVWGTSIGRYYSAGADSSLAQASLYDISLPNFEGVEWTDSYVYPICYHRIDVDSVVLLVRCNYRQNDVLKCAVKIIKYVKDVVTQSIWMPITGTLNNTLDDYKNTVSMSNDGENFTAGKGVYKHSYNNYQELISPFSELNLGVGKYYHFLDKNGKICSTRLKGVIELVEVKDSDDTDLINFSQSLLSNNSVSNNLSDLYVSVNNKLYITEPRYDFDGDFMLYIPDYNEQTFTSEITGLHPVSKTEMAVFLNDEIWVCTKQDSVFMYSKSKLPLGIPFGSTIAGTYEGDATIFMTKRGLATLKYQNFVASTEQNLSFVSDVIYSAIENKTQDLKQVILYKYWLICHNNNEAYVFDLRTSSWWPMRTNISINKFIEVDAKLYAYTGKFYELCVDDDSYYDEDGTVINWHITSQKLHFNAINYTKHIANITLYSVLDTYYRMKFDLQVKCYRKKTYTTDIETNEFEVDAIRTYVQRLSFPKVNEFQYKLSSDPQQAIRVPLSLSGFTVKYRIGSQVR